ncbi:hypothetical protein [Brevibacterium renqingii]|uniref:hypothetical protein n=1 Tax=Brevibacterium renqingii TaxID=2776916 RepID=UPI001ADF41ED|nr:hypothetical protein [Brevibacterium renqingii]
MTSTTTTEDELLTHLRSRLQEAWAKDPLFIEPVIEDGLSRNQLDSIEHASSEAAESDLPYFIAVLPDQPDGPGNLEDWGRVTSNLAQTMYESRDAEQVLVLFATAGGGSRSWPYLVSDLGPIVPRGGGGLTRSASDDFLPVELNVPYQMQILLAAAGGAPAPGPPQFDPKDVGQSNEDYIEKWDLDEGPPDVLVMGATALVAAGLTTWLLARRRRYAWRAGLTTAPELTKHFDLRSRVAHISEPLPEPYAAEDGLWQMYDRGRRVQNAVAAISQAHPNWADSEDFSHRMAVHCLSRSDKWIRRALRGREDVEEPLFCFFLPSHTGSIEPVVWKQKSTALTVNACDACRDDLTTGHDPVTLMVPKRPGAKRVRPVPYFLRDDAYATSGFGSFQALETAILARAPKAAGTMGERP